MKNNKSLSQSAAKNCTAGKTLPLILTISSALLFLFPGCAMVGPDYNKIEAEISQAWHTELQGGLSTHRDNLDTRVDWWELLEDPQLTRLVKRGISGNLDLQRAVLRIREARALKAGDRADLFPIIDASSSASRARTSSSASRARTSENIDSGQTNSFFRAGLDAGWEWDLFGGVRRSLQAAQANIEARQEDYHDVLVSLQAEVALNYLQVRAYQARLVVAKANLTVQEETYQLNQSRYKAGLIDELAVQQANYNQEQTRSQIPSLQTGLEIAKNRLAILLGEPPGAVHQDLATLKAIPQIPVSVVIGIPAETLRQRPDIRRAEREVAVQTALIGVAVSDLYPKFRLSGTLGLESLFSSDLFESASRTWGIGPAVTWNVFDAGKVRQNIEIQTARQEQAFIAYQSSVLNAQEEIENALVAFAKEQLRQQSLSKAAWAAKQADLISRDKYQAGLVDFNDVLDAQRSLFVFEDELAQSNALVAANLIQLYKALGGGWQIDK